MEACNLERKRLDDRAGMVGIMLFKLMRQKNDELLMRIERGEKEVPRKINRLRAKINLEVAVSDNQMKQWIDNVCPPRDPAAEWASMDVSDKKDHHPEFFTDVVARGVGLNIRNNPFKVFGLPASPAEMEHFKVSGQLPYATKQNPVEDFNLPASSIKNDGSDYFTLDPSSEEKEREKSLSYFAYPDGSHAYVRAKGPDAKEEKVPYTGEEEEEGPLIGYLVEKEPVEVTRLPNMPGYVKVKDPFNILGLPGLPG